MPIDPVCRKELDPLHAATSTSYKGHTLSFCSLRCKDEFQRNPGIFVRGAAAEKKKAGFRKRIFG